MLCCLKTMSTALRGFFSLSAAWHAASLCQQLFSLCDAEMLLVLGWIAACIALIYQFPRQIQKTGDHVGGKFHGRLLEPRSRS